MRKIQRGGLIQLVSTLRQSPINLYQAFNQCKTPQAAFERWQQIFKYEISEPISTQKDPFLLQDPNNQLTSGHVIKFHLERILKIKKGEMDALWRKNGLIAFQPIFLKAVEKLFIGNKKNPRVTLPGSEECAHFAGFTSQETDPILNRIISGSTKPPSLRLNVRHLRPYRLNLEEKVSQRLLDH